MLSFKIFESRTVEKLERARGGDTYFFKSDVGSCSAFALWGAQYQNEMGCAPMWGICHVRRTRLGEALTQYYNDRQFFVYDRGGTLEGYMAFYKDGYARDPENLKAIFEADKAGHERLLERIARHVGPNGGGYSG